MQWVNTQLLDKLLNTVRSSPHSDFYARKYAGLPVTQEHFFTLPLLTKDDLLEAPLASRLYVPKKDVRFVAFTSGTSSKQALMMPFADVADYFFEPSLGTGVTRPLVIHPPLMKSFGHTFMQQCRQAKHPLSALFGDVQNLANSALVASAVGCDSIYSIPTIAGLFAPFAEELGIAQGIKLIALSSETITTARREQLKKAFPNALVANLYGSTELGQLPFFSCPSMMRREENHFHVLTDALAAVEIIEGELVVSYGLNPAAPLVRYRTGDYFEEVGEGCDCSLPGPVVRWSHRHEVDRLRVNGIEFDIEEADRAFARLSMLAAANYQVHFRSKKGETGISMYIEVAEPVLARNPMQAAVIAREVEHKLPELWRISSTATLRTALEKGLFSGVTVSIVPALSYVSLKAKRFINHVE